MLKDMISFIQGWGNVIFTNPGRRSGRFRGGAGKVGMYTRRGRDGRHGWNAGDE
jgi:hypothetical protein